MSDPVTLREAADLALMYLRTGFIECDQCGHEVPTATLDAVWQLEEGLSTPTMPDEASNNRPATKSADPESFATGESGSPPLTEVQPVAATLNETGVSLNVEEAGAREVRHAVARCLQIVRETSDGFLSEEYATGQPISSFSERFACSQVMEAIGAAFGMGTAEQRRLLGMPTMAEEYRASLAKGER